MKPDFINRRTFSYRPGVIYLVLISVLHLGVVFNAVDKRNLPTTSGICVYEPFFTDSAFTGTYNAWVVPLSGAGLFLTKNGGQEWEQISRKDFHGLRLISFVDINTGWTIGDGKVWKTINSGKSWMPITGDDSAITTLQMPRKLLFLNRTDGIILDAYNGILITQDGGINWRVVEYNKSELVQAYPTGLRSALIETADGSILNASIQKGEITWKRSRTPRSLPIIDFCFISSELGWIVSENAIFKTETGGDLWLQQPPIYLLKENGIIESIRFIDNQTGWACATSSYFIQDQNVRRIARKGFIFKTSDGGMTWKLLYEKLGHPFDKIYFSDSKNGWILADDKVLRSVDGGTTWSQVLDMKSPSKCT